MAGGLGLGLGAALLGKGAALVRAAPQGQRHLVWVWQFSTDAEPNIVGARLLENGLGIVLKTHDGQQWMSEYDKSPYAVSGPAQLAVLANYYETAGVPFHAWCVVHGTEPLREAKMAADVLNAGARSIYLDVEPHSGFWRGTPADAVAFGKELRRLAPNGMVSLSVDPRPWMISRLPMREFADFSDEISPQQYWRTFNTPANYERFAETGFPVPPEGVTPEFLYAVSDQVLTPLGRPLSHVGQGATPDANEWRRFIDLSFARGSNMVTVWRYGVTTPEVLRVLRDMPPRVPVEAAPVAAAEAGVYVVQAGDSLSVIAARNGVSVQQLMDANGLSDPHYIYVGQQLKVPGTAVAAAQSGAPAGAPASQPAPAATNRTHTVENGDTLYAIAGRFGTTVDAIAQANGLTDPDLLAIGQVLKIV
jgi:LysM repeat protein